MNEFPFNPLYSPDDYQGISVYPPNIFPIPDFMMVNVSPWLSHLLWNASASNPSSVPLKINVLLYFLLNNFSSFLIVSESVIILDWINKFSKIFGFVILISCCFSSSFTNNLLKS